MIVNSLIQSRICQPIHIMCKDTTCNVIQQFIGHEFDSFCCLDDARTFVGGEDIGYDKTSWYMRYGMLYNRIGQEWSK
eukprot:2484267-Ditylum_brightwellii.AAC.1